MAWVRRNLLTFAAMVTLFILLLPNVVVALFSFNKPNGRYNYQWVRFSTDAWANPCGTPGICDSLGLSLRIGITASVVATILGTMVAFALGRFRFRGRATTNLLIFMPMATPEVVMGSSLLTLFVMMGLSTGALAILIAHIMFCVSFVVVAVKARVASLDPRLEEAAADLGATPVATFMKVTLPLVAPGIAAGALLAFSLSFDDYIITNFNASPSSVTFPMYVWGAAQRGTPVQINVVGTVMFVLSVGIVLTAQLISRRRARKA
ncbi:ABC transporter permease [Phycicoccus sp. M110.8]|jgi:spermidine/putrescine transport system permease protein|uniref:ABC transporter permease n=1 Tax=Phycicoccus sp. M110.8 TaxID=3075433 RepID=UPI0028FD4CE1|nr:ABC transporter permease [Phycicoccus sp. M110.8]MDU0314516.1 ABC transporter permease [Phycicoccus sp. M110.8]HET8768078.1 ABC transporter permease [Pedococcus sp.]